MSAGAVLDRMKGLTSDDILECETFEDVATKIGTTISFLRDDAARSALFERVEELFPIVSQLATELERDDFDSGSFVGRTIELRPIVVFTLFVRMMKPNEKMSGRMEAVVGAFIPTVHKLMATSLAAAKRRGR